MPLVGGAKRKNKGGGRKPKGRPLTQKQRKEVKSIVVRNINSRSETKYWDQTNSGSTDYAGQIGLVNDIPQGTTDSTRIGDELYMKSINLTYNVSVATADVTNVMRVILFQWFDDSTATDASILAGVGSVLDVI